MVRTQREITHEIFNKIHEHTLAVAHNDIWQRIEPGTYLRQFQNFPSEIATANFQAIIAGTRAAIRLGTSERPDGITQSYYFQAFSGLFALFMLILAYYDFANDMFTTGIINLVLVGGHLYLFFFQVKLRRRIRHRTGWA